MMDREIITTDDGSHTIQLKEWDEQYHSKHGAIQEAYHVFIQNGLSLYANCKISILEIGFGTGLNALITFLEARKAKLDVRYVGVERYPVTSDEFNTLNYIEKLKAAEFTTVFEHMHECAWEEDILISDTFQLRKVQKDFKDLDYKNEFDLVYFDAFGPRVQPELWTEDIFDMIFNALRAKGVLVTYSAKGSVRRAMQAVGFTVERLPGPPGKREMLRATKLVC